MAPIERPLRHTESIELPLRVGRRGDVQSATSVGSSGGYKASFRWKFTFYVVFCETPFVSERPNPP